VDALSDYQAQSPVEFSITQLDPLDSELSDARKDELVAEAKTYGLKKRMIDVIESDRRIQQSVWFDVVFLYQGRQMVMPRVTRGVDAEYAITRTLKTILDAQYTPPVIGFTVSHGEAPILQSPLRPKFEDNGSLIGVPLDGNAVPDRIDVLVILGPTRPLNERALYTIDQFLMRGGTLIALLDYRQQSRQFPDLLLATAPGLHTLLSQYGIDIEIERTVIDRESPATTMVMTDPQQPPSRVAHPLYVFSKPSLDGHPITEGLSDVVTPVVSHIELSRAREMGLDVSPILMTSAQSVRRRHVKHAGPAHYDSKNDDDTAGPAVTGAVVRGRLPSAFSGDAIPEAPEPSPFAPPVRQSPHLESAEAPSRILLVTSGQRMLAALHNGPLLLENAVAWGGASESLNALRSRRALTPRLHESDADTRLYVRVLNLVGPCALLFTFGFAFRFWRSRT